MPLLVFVVPCESLVFRAFSRRSTPNCRVTIAPRGNRSVGLGFLKLSEQRFWYRKPRQSPPTSELAESAFQVVVRNAVSSVNRNGRHSSTTAAIMADGGGGDPMLIKAKRHVVRTPSFITMSGQRPYT